MKIVEMRGANSGIIYLVEISKNKYDSFKKKEQRSPEKTYTLKEPIMKSLEKEKGYLIKGIFELVDDWLQVVDRGDFTLQLTETWLSEQYVTLSMGMKKNRCLLNFNVCGCPLSLNLLTGELSGNYGDSGRLSRIIPSDALGLIYVVLRKRLRYYFSYLSKEEVIALEKEYNLPEENYIPS